MSRIHFGLGVLVGCLMLHPGVRAQQALPESPLERQLRQDKSAYYTQIEYQRCRSDIIELLAKAEPLEKRLKEVEDENRKLREELDAVKAQKPAGQAG